MSESITNFARMLEIKSVLYIAINWIARACDYGCVDRRHDGNFVGARGVKPEAAVSLKFIAADLPRV